MHSSDIGDSSYSSDISTEEISLQKKRYVLVTLGTVLIEVSVVKGVIVRTELKGLKKRKKIKIPHTGNKACLDRCG